MGTHLQAPARGSTPESSDSASKTRGSPGNSRAQARLAPSSVPSAASVLAGVGEGGLAGEPPPGGASPGDLFAAATDGGGGSLPYAAEMGVAFGVDLSDVSAHVGQPGPLGAMGARAATDGRSVAFADASPARSTVAHEIAHVAQQRSSGGGTGGVHASSTVSRPGDASEVEADRAAADVVAGRTPTVTEAPGAGVISLEADPRAYAPTPTMGGVQREADFGDTFSSTPGAVRPSASVAPGESTVMNITVEHDREHPLDLGVGDTPAEEELFTVVNREPVSTADTLSITQKFGSTQAPNVRPIPDPTSMYIGGAPQLDDLSQGGIGDCWLMAALSNVVSRDPNKIPSMMTFTPTTVSATFHHFDNSTPPGRWVAATMTTANTLLHYQDPADPTATYELVGAGLRRADEPSGSLWYGFVRGSDLYVVRRDKYEVALWAPMIEKLYAQFTEAFGQYGGGPSPREGSEPGGAGSTTSGYQNIDGGWEDQAYPVFYGANVVSHGQEDINYTPNTNPVLANQGAIANLLRLAGEGVPADQTFMLSVDLDQGSAVARLRQLIDFVVGDRDSRRYPTLRNALVALGTRCDDYTGAPAGGPVEAAALSSLARDAEAHARPTAWPMLSSPSALPRYHELYELLNTIKSLGTDHSPGRRNTYADHAYPVLGASFVGIDGNALTLTQATLAAEAANIDPAASTVRMRNPHHTNEPNVPTSARDANPNDGLFTLSLDQYLRDFALQQVALVRNTPAPAGP